MNGYTYRERVQYAAKIKFRCQKEITPLDCADQLLAAPINKFKSRRQTYICGFIFMLRVIIGQDFYRLSPSPFVKLVLAIVEVVDQVSYQCVELLVS